ncbi:spastin [Anaeramoeba flamelloides]|uniref:Spastin n=1 Tax=Anaeramoeba flamelloides TaxID=1746091 RepID=A0AAV7Y9C2_9EUKA|nr:spastin [Anaeramoeba flamelloides]
MIITGFVTNLKKQQMLYNEGRTYIDLAINQENENTYPTLSLSNYLKGRNKLNRALTLKFTKSEKKISDPLNDEIIQILNSVNERIKKLKMLEMKSLVIQQEQLIQRRQTQQSYLQQNKIQEIFQPPRVTDRENRDEYKSTNTKKKKSKNKQNKAKSINGIPQELIERIKNEMIDNTEPLTFQDIAGLEVAKKALHESIVLPNKRPEIFKGLRTPPKGILLFGPPGNGKTMIARATAAASNCTFFSITSASITSKFVGEGEKLVRALFMVARQNQPSIIFIDEIDSILGERGGKNELESSRAIKNEFLTQIEGVTSKNDERVLLVAATNRPYDLDGAVLRRFRKKIYIPPPDKKSRVCLIANLLRKQDNNITKNELEKIAKKTDGFSGSDLRNLALEAAMFSIRELNEEIEYIEESKIRPISYQDFLKALKTINTSLEKKSMVELEEWNQKFGCN